MEVTKYAGSKAVMTSNVQRFTLPSTDTSVSEKRHVKYMPISNSLTPLEFTIPALDTYVDLNMSYFVAQVHFELPNGNAIADASTVYPKPNLIHTMIKQFNMTWNGVLLNPQTDTYSYRAWIPKVLNYMPEKADTILAPEGFWERESKTQVMPIEPPRVLNPNLVNFADNAMAGHNDLQALPLNQQGFLWDSKREKEKFHNKAWNTFIFKPQHKLFYSHHLTLPGIEQKFNFTFHSQKFYMNGVGVNNMAVKELESDNLAKVFLQIIPNFRAIIANTFFKCFSVGSRN